MAERCMLIVEDDASSGSSWRASVGLEDHDA
jgi:hypothetical protein